MLSNVNHRLQCLNCVANPNRSSVRTIQYRGSDHEGVSDGRPQKFILIARFFFAAADGVVVTQVYELYILTFNVHAPVVARPKITERLLSAITGNLQ